MKKIIQSDLLASYPHLIHGTSTKDFGNMSFERSQNNNAPQNLNSFLHELNVDLQQTSLFIMNVGHGTNIAFIKNKGQKKGRIIMNNNSPEITNYYRLENCSGHDGLISQSPNTILGILNADCAPVMVHDPISKSFGLIHASHKAIKTRVIENFFLVLKAWISQIDYNNIICYIGPCICNNCYKSNGKKTDLRQLLLQKLAAKGIMAHNIEISDECTCENEHLFFSNYRAQDKNAEGRNLSLIGLR